MAFRYEDEEVQSVHGLRMSKEAFEQLVDVGSSYRYEMIDGIVYNMAHPSIEHNDIVDNIIADLKQQLGKTGPCRAYREQRVAIPGKPSVEPDIVVSCNLDDWDKKRRNKKHPRIDSPLIVIEVLSPSTEPYDRAEKFARYQLCPTLEVYILVSQDERQVEVYRKEAHWKLETFSASQTIHLDQLDLELSLDEVYDGVL